jgi:hypothetical protein
MASRRDILLCEHNLYSYFKRSPKQSALTEQMLHEITDRWIFIILFSYNNSFTDMQQL